MLVIIYVNGDRNGGGIIEECKEYFLYYKGRI